MADYEADMASYFERLLAEEDPTRIAAMAESMPEPPDLANMAAAITEPAAEPYPVAAVMTTVEPDAPEGFGADAPAEAEMAEAAEAPEATADEATPELAFAAAEAEAADFSGEPEDDGAPVTATTETDVEMTEPDTSSETSEATDTNTATADAGAETAAAEPRPAGERATTRVIVHGLVSVASIATFKRSLGRVPGVSAIGVSSGPDGEFVFTVSHDSTLALADAITALPGFDARIASQTDGGLEVAAHDPDAGD